MDVVDKLAEEQQVMSGGDMTSNRRVQLYESKLRMFILVRRSHRPRCPPSCPCLLAPPPPPPLPQRMSLIHPIPLLQHTRSIICVQVDDFSYAKYTRYAISIQRLWRNHAKRRRHRQEEKTKMLESFISGLGNDTQRDLDRQQTISASRRDSRIRNRKSFEQPRFANET